MALLLCTCTCYVITIDRELKPIIGSLSNINAIVNSNAISLTSISQTRVIIWAAIQTIMRGDAPLRYCEKYHVAHIMLKRRCTAFKWRKFNKIWSCQTRDTVRWTRTLKKRERQPILLWRYMNGHIDTDERFSKVAVSVRVSVRIAHGHHYS